MLIYLRDSQLANACTFACPEWCGSRLACDPLQPQFLSNTFTRVVRLLFFQYSRNRWLIRTSTITPFVFSGIFFAANGEFHIAYIDSLFLCFSAMTVTGLATVDLSSLTGFQQSLLFILQSLGSPVCSQDLANWAMTLTRCLGSCLLADGVYQEVRAAGLFCCVSTEHTSCHRRYFIIKFEHIVQAEIEKRRAIVEEGGLAGNLGKRLSRIVTRGRSLSIVNENSRSSSTSKRRRFGFPGKDHLPKFSARMVRRMDDAPKPIDPSGFVSHEAPSTSSTSQPTPALTPILSPRAGTPNSIRETNRNSIIIDERRNSGDIRCAINCVASPGL